MSKDTQASLQGQQVEVTEETISFKRDCEQYGVIYDDFRCFNNDAGITSALNVFTARLLD